MNRPSLCLCIHDICTYAKSSLTVVIPILESMGVEALPIVTGILSSQTDGFEDYYHYSLKDHIDKIGLTLAKENLKVDSVYSGFLSSADVAHSVLKLQDELKGENCLMAVDPVLGDHGTLYSGFDLKMIDAMRLLIKEAHLIKPNWTEACLLTDTAFKPVISENDLKTVLSKLRELSPRSNIALTDVKFKGSENLCSVACLDTSQNSWVYSHKRIPVSLPGSGDFFCSIMVGSILCGLSFEEAVKKASDSTQACIELTTQTSLERRHGISTALWLRESLKKSLQ